MEPNLLVGDRLFVTKYSYGYSKHSFPFSPPLFNGRKLFLSPKVGDVVVFKTPSDNRTDYIKRLIGLPGDKIQFIDGSLFLNNSEIFKDLKSNKEFVYCGVNKINSNYFTENLPNGKKFMSAYFKQYTLQNTDLFEVPDDHYFFLGDNRDCSKDSRFLSSVGYVHRDNLVGKAQFIFFSSDSKKGSIFEFWRWGELIRLDRFFKRIN
jgi:signal peptidase I